MSRSVHGAMCILLLSSVACGKAPVRSDFASEPSQEDEAMVNLALSNSKARWCDLYVTYPHRSDPAEVLIECQPYQKPIEHWIWRRGSHSATHVGKL